MSYQTWKTTSTTYSTYLIASNNCKKAFTMEEAPVKPQVNEWKHPKTGQTRQYINNVAEIIGLELGYYKSGNISWASLSGKNISNAEGARINGATKDAKFWIDDTNKLHHNNMSVTWRPRSISFDEVRDMVAESIAHHASN